MFAEAVTDGTRRGVQRRLYRAIREAILGGTLASGARLPATRALAQEYGLARQTVVEVYERLLSEGYVVSHAGGGTFVSGAIRLERPGEAGTREPPAMAVPPSPALARWAERAEIIRQEIGASDRPAFDFRPGVPDWEAFPQARWRQLQARRWRDPGQAVELGQYGDPAGYPPLRAALATYLASARGVRCAPSQVIIVTGSQQALDLLARVFLEPGAAAVVEEPGYPPARAIFAAAGATLLPVPVDAEGLSVPALRCLDLAGDQAPRLAYITPSHHYPTGVTLSLARRLELLDWAARAGALLVEDDYDSELRYAGPPLPALQGLDGRGCVVYIGSCSSVLFPPLRVGWIVAPPSLVDALVAAKWLADRQTATLDQQVLADFIVSGDLARHLRRSRVLYAARRAALEAAVHRHLPSGCTLAGDAAGLQTPLYLPPDVDEAAVAEAAGRRGVGVYPLGPCYADVSGVPAASSMSGMPGMPDLPGLPHARHLIGPVGPAPVAPRQARRPGLLLGFAAMREATIAEGIRRLAEALAEVSASSR